MPFDDRAFASKQNEEEQRKEGCDETSTTDVLPQFLSTRLSGHERWDHRLSLAVERSVLFGDSTGNLGGVGIAGRQGGAYGG
jgi:hypothetical protein